jgi:hypothetical protein
LLVYYFVTSVGINTYNYKAMLRACALLKQRFSSLATQARGEKRVQRSVDEVRAAVAQHSFSLQSVEQVPDFRVTLYDLRHSCGTRYVHLDTADTNNAFCLLFRTLPNDSTGFGRSKF